MNKPFGLRGQLQPSGYYQSQTEHLSVDGIDISVTDGVLEVGYDNESDEARARERVVLYLAAATMHSGIRVSVQLNQSWKINIDGSKNIGISLSETVRLTDHVIITTADIHGTASIVKYDSHDFGNHTELVRKAMQDPVLARALKFYSEEAVDSERPLYGIYKALEEIEKSLGSGSKGRENLARLAGQNKVYLDDVMETAQKTRHYTGYPARERLSENECRERAKALIGAYADSIP
jgi:hypothetical protein